MNTWERKDIALLIVKYLQGDLSEKEKLHLNKWRGASVRHEEAFQKYLSGSFYEEMKTLYIPGEEAKLYKMLRKKVVPRKVKILRGGGNMELCSYLIATICVGSHALSFFS